MTQEGEEYFRSHKVADTVEKMLKQLLTEKPELPLRSMHSIIQQECLAQLNKEHGVKDRVEFGFGPNGSLKVKLQHGDGATDGNICEVYLQGAHVTRWSVGGFDALWLSPDTEYAEGKAIRGGIPICWPQFGPGKLKQHGFLRNSSDWTVHETEANDVNVMITLKHTDTKDTRALWDHKFEVLYTIYLKPHTLTTVLKVVNTGDKPFDFTTALHTYFHVPNIARAGVQGLNGLKYWDNLQERKEMTEENTDEFLRITGETDRIYLNAPPEVLIDDGFGCSTVVHKSPNLPDVVLWNPWIEKAKATRDFNNYGWRSMVCVEVGAIKDPVTVKPGETWFGSQTLSAKTVNKL